MNAALCFHFHVCPSDDGRMLLTGYCTDKGGTQYSFEEGSVISEEALNKLREMKLDDLADRKGKFNLPFLASDKTDERLILTAPNGKQEQKELTAEVRDAIFEVLFGEFLRNVPSLEK